MSSYMIFWVHIHTRRQDNTIFWFKNIVLYLYIIRCDIVSWMKCYYFICAKRICVRTQRTKRTKVLSCIVSSRSLLNKIFCEIHLYVYWKQTKRFGFEHVMATPSYYSILHIISRALDQYNEGVSKITE